MAGSFQNEIPAARINLKLDVGKGDAKKKTELPLKMLVNALHYSEALLETVVVLLIRLCGRAVFFFSFAPVSFFRSASVRTSSRPASLHKSSRR